MRRSFSLVKEDTAIMPAKEALLNIVAIRDAKILMDHKNHNP